MANNVKFLNEDVVLPPSPVVAPSTSKVARTNGSKSRRRAQRNTVADSVISKYIIQLNEFLIIKLQAVFVDLDDEPEHAEPAPVQKQNDSFSDTFEIENYVMSIKVNFKSKIEKIPLRKVITN